eukprot:c10638_g1_i2.p1 GENE.c10638_g1_i2~~c10638_g1_i2.p1  ORF type:complete len:212 (+),score=69.32 c10638_g1_i2:73-636(+)
MKRDISNNSLGSLVSDMSGSSQVPSPSNDQDQSGLDDDYETKSGNNMTSPPHINESTNQNAFVESHQVVFIRELDLDQFLMFAKGIMQTLDELKKSMKDFCDGIYIESKQRGITEKHISNNNTNDNNEKVALTEKPKTSTFITHQQSNKTPVVKVETQNDKIVQIVSSIESPSQNSYLYDCSSSESS